MGIVTGVSMLFSFMAGMMMHDIKYIIAEKAPFLNLINPVNMITDGLYSLYYYDTLDRYLFNISSLVMFTVVMLSLSYIVLRRKNYDSI